MITIKKIAELANVSGATVSRVINNSGYVSDEVRARVMKVIEEHQYVPSEHAKALRTKKSKVIGVILPKLSTETASRVVDGINEELSAKGYQIILASTNLDPVKEIEYLKLLKSRQVDGIILNATNVNDALLQEIKKLSLPFVAIGQELPGEATVNYDNYKVAKEVTSLFINKGHKKIAFIGVNERDRAVGYWRKKGYENAMNENNLAIEDGWVKEATFSTQSGYEAMESIMAESAVKPTATFAVTDRLAVGAMQFLKNEGFNIPADMALAGIGDSEISKYVEPALTTVSFENELAGKEAAKLILRKINNQEVHNKNIILDYRLLIRDSV